MIRLRVQDLRRGFFAASKTLGVYVSGLKVSGLGSHAQRSQYELPGA